MRYCAVTLLNVMVGRRGQPAGMMTRCASPISTSKEADDDEDDSCFAPSAPPPLPPIRESSRRSSRFFSTQPPLLLLLLSPLPAQGIFISANSTTRIAEVSEILTLASCSTKSPTIAMISSAVERMKPAVEADMLLRRKVMKTMIAPVTMAMTRPTRRRTNSKLTFSMYRALLQRSAAAATRSISSSCRPKIRIEVAPISPSTKSSVIGSISASESDLRVTTAGGGFSTTAATTIKRATGAK